jgi:hypothetical protein
VFTFETTTSPGAVREGVWVGWRRTKLKRALVGVLVAAIVGAYIGSRVPGGPSFLFLLPIVTVAAGIYAIVVYGLLLARAIKRQTEAARRSGVERWVFDDGGITIENHERKVQLKWEAVSGYREAKTLVFFRLAPTWVGIPVDLLTDDQRQRLLKVFESRGIRRLN